MNIIKGIFNTAFAIVVVGIALYGQVWSETIDFQVKPYETLDVYQDTEIMQFFEIQSIDMGDVRQNQLLPQCTSGEFSIVVGRPSISMDFLTIIEPAPIKKDIEPTTTINIVFEVVDVPFNGIPKAPSEEKLFEIFGDDIIITRDPERENHVIVAIPALTVEESHEVLCEIFSAVVPPRLLLKESISVPRAIFIALDIDLVKFENTPFLQIHKILDRSGL